MTVFSLAFVAGLKRATDEGSLPEIAQYSPYYLPLNVFTVSNGSTLYNFIYSVKIVKRFISYLCILNIKPELATRL